MNSFKEFEQKAWERKANLYADSWGSVSSQPASRIIEIANITKGTKLLDIGCGPGQLCGLAHDAGADLIGCDLSGEMIKIARKNHPQITFQTEDAESLSFSDNSFDVVTLNYLLLHVPDQKRVLLEAKRVLKSEGILIFTLWKEPSESPALNLIFDSIKSYADGTLIPKADDTFQFSRTDAAREFLTGSGFGDFKNETFETIWQTSSEENFYSSVLSGTRIGGTIEIQSPEVRQKIRTKMFSDLENFKTAGGFQLSIPSVISSARKL